MVPARRGPTARFIHPQGMGWIRPIPGAHGSCCSLSPAGKAGLPFRSGSLLRCSLSGQGPQNTSRCVGNPLDGCFGTQAPSFLRPRQTDSPLLLALGRFSPWSWFSHGQPRQQSTDISSHTDRVCHDDAWECRGEVRKSPPYRPTNLTHITAAESIPLVFHAGGLCRHAGRCFRRVGGGPATTTRTQPANCQQQKPSSFATMAVRGPRGAGEARASGPACHPSWATTTTTSKPP